MARATFRRIQFCPACECLYKEAYLDEYWSRSCPGCGWVIDSRLVREATYTDIFKAIVKLLFRKRGTQ